MRGVAHKLVEGDRFGRLIVIRRDGHIGNAASYECLCDCGATTRVRASFLARGITRSCGCLFLDMTTQKNLTHGHARVGRLTPEFRTWLGIKRRCSEPTHISFKNYGGRGIRVCAQWLENFENFYADMGAKPGPDHSIDRIDNDGNYEPGNCRWATVLQQANNRSNSRAHS